MISHQGFVHSHHYLTCLFVNKFYEGVHATFLYGSCTQHLVQGINKGLNYAKTDPQHIPQWFTDTVVGLITLLIRVR